MKDVAQGYEAEALGLLLDASFGKTRTVIVEFVHPVTQAESEVVIVLKAPPEGEVMKTWARAQAAGQEEQLSAASEFLCLMAHHPKRGPAGELRNLTDDDENPHYEAGSRMFTVEEHLDKMQKLPIGHPFAAARAAALDFVQELGNELGNSNQEVASGGTSESQNSSAESTNETSNSGTKDE